MTNPPNGPGSPDGDDALSEMLRRMFGANAPDPEELRRALGGMGGGTGAGPGGLPFDPSQLDPAMMSQMMQQFQAMMQSSPEDGPVNWTLARQSARQAAAGQDPTVGTFARREIDEALRLAELWLDGATEIEATGLLGKAWSRAEWVEASMDTWQRLTEPVAVSMSEAMSRALKDQLPGQVPEEMQGMQGMLEGLQPMLQNMGGTMFGLQLGQAVGALAQEVLSGTDSGFPVAGHQLAMVPVNIEEFGDGLEVPDDQIRIYLALREVARMRLFVHSPWLERDLYAAIEQYAAGVHIDMSKIEDAARAIDPSDPESMQEAFAGASFIPEPTGPQKAALERLELTLALIEGWVDVVVTEAAQPLDAANALRETINRRRATGGPAEHAFGTLVGLDLRPRRLREAATLWEKIGESQGREYRDAIWRHPDLQPTPEDLDDPDGYVGRRQAREQESAGLDDELRKLLDGGFDGGGEQKGDGTGEDKGEDK
ncbi:zinc-dependent metalloprotease [Citricoccus nitrophenolicus]|uniref:Zinc-dependent metalloprotease n=1 Tax=Citricoccus nitrophenolicus TaxID=863575 RepID=A0ABV0ILE9_9MICC